MLLDCIAINRTTKLLLRDDKSVSLDTVLGLTEIVLEYIYFEFDDETYR